MKTQDIVDTLHVPKGVDCTKECEAKVHEFEEYITKSVVAILDTLDRDLAEDVPAYLLCEVAHTMLTDLLDEILDNRE